MNVMCFWILAVQPLRAAVVVAEDSLSYVAALVCSRGFYLPPAAPSNRSSSQMIWADCFQLL